MALSRRDLVPAGLLILAIPLLSLLALAARVNHDESQYVAGAAFSARGLLIFRDFAYLQTPLHAWACAPIALAAPAWTFPAMRIATALSAVALLALVYRAQRRAAVPRTPALIATVLLASCAAFQFAATVNRNDMLPAILAAGALLFLSGVHRRPAAAGLLLGLAVAAKLTYLPVLAGGIALLGAERDWKGLLRIGVGGLIGLAPAFAMAAIAPAQFWHGVVTYGATAPFHWYEANGLWNGLSVFAKLAGSVRALAQGPALAVLLMLLLLGRRPSREIRPAVALGAGALLALLLPTPTHLQYALPVLPPLFVMAGHGLAAVWPKRPIKVAALTVLAVMAAIGSVRSAKALSRAAHAGLPALTVARTAAEIARLAPAGPIATLSPERAIGAQRPVDPWFAAGPFLFRSGALLSPAEAQALRATTPATLDAHFALHPPGSILTGYEGPTRRFRLAPDRPLERWARGRGWQPTLLGDGRGRLWLPPVVPQP
jgi:4-amino-4-deoxy-L-arabinose transferase-like glycosyltransferase